MVIKWRQGSALAAQSRCPVYVACGLYVIGYAYGSMIYISNFLFICPYSLFAVSCFYIAVHIHSYYIIKIASSKNNLQILRSFFNF